MGRDATTSLAPGFRFHPTDEELVRYYLKRKVCNKPLRFDPISVIDIYRSEPWDLPDKSKLKSRDLEWYFFSGLDKKYGNGSRTNRATEKGYWKTTGKDREIRYYSRIVGMKKTLVYHKGRAPRGERTNWVMHEYRLADKELEKAGIAQDSFVLCRVFQKSGSGPKNGEQYGAPFIEEEWEDDDAVFVPGQDYLPDEVVVGEDAFVEVNDIDQKFDIDVPYENASATFNFYYGESSNNAESGNNIELGNNVESDYYIEQTGVVAEGDQKPIIDMGNTAWTAEDNQKPLIGTREIRYDRRLPDDPPVSDLPELNDIDVGPIKHEYVEKSGDVSPFEINYLLDEPYMDATENLMCSDEFLEANDLSNPAEVDGFDFENCLTFLDVDDDNSQYLALDPSQTMENENSVSDLAPCAQKQVLGESEAAASANHPLSTNNNDDASCSKQKPDVPEFGSDVKYPFLKQASQVLSNIPAPPAFACEFPTKDAALRLNTVAESSGSVHVTAGMIRITNMTLAGNQMAWSFNKNGDINIVFSLGLSQENAGLVPMANVLSDKPGSIGSRGLLFLMFFWVLILSVSFKVGTCVYSR